MLNFLVPVSDRDQNWYGLHAALGLAKRFKGHVDLVFVHAEVRLDIARQTAAGPAYAMREILARLNEEAAEMVAKAERTFARLLQEHNVPSSDGPGEPGRPTASLTVSKGTVRNAIERWGGVHDATVFARAAAGGDGVWRESVETALFTTGQPVFLVPLEDRSGIGETVLIGWNRSAQSARALRDALPLLERAKNVFVFSVKTGAKEGPSPQEAGRHLEWHGIKNEVLEIAPSRMSVGQALIAQAHEVEADLVVMGAYSHSRFREAILGGVTRQVLAKADIPVLMSH